MVTVATHGPKPKPQPIYPARRGNPCNCFLAVHPNAYDGSP